MVYREFKGGLNRVVVGPCLPSLQPTQNFNHPEPTALRVVEILRRERAGKARQLQVVKENKIKNRREETRDKTETRSKTGSRE
jgi:hypothetical protein